MRRALLTVGMCVTGAGLVVAGWPILRQGSVAAAADRRVTARQLEASFAGLDPILKDVAGEVRGRFAKGSQGPPERSVSWTAKDGTAMTMSISAKEVEGKVRLITRLEAQRDLQDMSQSFNLQYLSLQQQMQDENRRFTLVSNIMKTKHDTARNSISNIR